MEEAVTRDWSVARAYAPQVAGRADVPWDEWVEMDLDHIEGMSPWTDVKLIARAFGVVLGKAGAH